MKLLNKISGMKVVSTITQKRIPTWDIRPGLQVGCKVTLRREKADELLKRLLTAGAEKINALKFDKFGNFSFGIPEYLDVAGIEYDAGIGIIGFDVAVTLERPGFRIKKRRNRKRIVSKKHSISKEEAINFIKQKYNFEVN
jgi:large subunit ribosomal protein L5